MSAPIISQPWEDVASDVTGAIEKAVQPLLKKAVDEIYSGLLDATQDYLTDNLAFNIASRIDAAEREAARDRQRCAALLEALEQVARPYGMLDIAVAEHMHGPRGDDMLAVAKIVRAAIAEARGDA